MIRYHMLTEAELAERSAPEKAKYGEFGPTDRLKTVKRSALKKQHHDRQKDPPPRKIAKRHAAPRKP